jgi:hypothetical protein
MVKINFDELINNYDDNLLDNLRGFGKEKEYLKFWVPGTSQLQSFNNLIDALIEANFYKFSISFKELSCDNEFSKNVELFLKKIGEFNNLKKQNIKTLDIKINKKNYEEYKWIKKSYLKNIDTDKKKFDEKKEITIFKSDKEIEKIYETNLQKMNFKDYYSNKKLTDKNLYMGSIDKYNLYFLVKDKIIVDLYHNCNEKIVLKKLIDAFMNICIKKNIQEASDHGVIYLEEKIRLQGRSITKPGIILPSHAGTHFDSLNKIIRKIFNDYKKNSSTDFNVNKNHYRKSYQWINLPEEIKIKEINLVVKKIIEKNNLSEENISIQSIDHNFKINFGVDRKFKDVQDKKNLLLELEIALKKIDETLEVFIDEVLDQNKLRLKNSPQTKLIT